MNIEVTVNYFLAFLLVLLGVIILAFCIVRRGAIRQYKQQQASQHVKFSRERATSQGDNYRTVERAGKAA